jgi:hypothetical protein
VISRHPELNTKDIVEFLEDGAQHHLALNADTYFEGNEKDANPGLLGAFFGPIKANTFTIIGRDGTQFRVTVDRIEDLPYHYHPTVADLENGPSPADIPEPCFCTHPEADYTKLPEEGCKACGHDIDDMFNCGSHKGKGK